MEVIEPAPVRTVPTTEPEKVLVEVDEITIKQSRTIRALIVNALTTAAAASAYIKPEWVEMIGEISPHAEAIGAGLVLMVSLGSAAVAAGGRVAASSREVVRIIKRK